MAPRQTRSSAWRISVIASALVGIATLVSLGATPTQVEQHPSPLLTGTPITLAAGTTADIEWALARTSSPTDGFCWRTILAEKLVSENCGQPDPSFDADIVDLSKIKQLHEAHGSTPLSPLTFVIGNTAPQVASVEIAMTDGRSLSARTSHLDDFFERRHFLVLTPKVTWPQVIRAFDSGGRLIWTSKSIAPPPDISH